jgi:hypothetical protein
MRPRGLAIFLAILGVDRFEYHSENGRNVNVFKVRIRHD